MDRAGIPKIDSARIMARVMENRDRLDGCPRHLFEPLPLETIRLGAKIKCKRCEGDMDLVALNFYIRGYEAAGRDGNDILPGWKDAPEAAPKRKHFGGPTFED
jgi:hypothetical protein